MSDNQPTYSENDFGKPKNISAHKSDVPFKGEMTFEGADTQLAVSDKSENCPPKPKRNLNSKTVLSLLKSIDDGLFRCDENGLYHLTCSNVELAKHAGISRQGLIGRMKTMKKHGVLVSSVPFVIDITKIPNINLRRYQFETQKKQVQAKQVSQTNKSKTDNQNNQLSDKNFCVHEKNLNTAINIENSNSVFNDTLNDTSYENAALGVCAIVSKCLSSFYPEMFTEKNLNYFIDMIDRLVYQSINHLSVNVRERVQAKNSETFANVSLTLPNVTEEQVLQKNVSSNSVNVSSKAFEQKYSDISHKNYLNILHNHENKEFNLEDTTLEELEKENNRLDSIILLLEMEVNKKKQERIKQLKKSLDYESVVDTDSTSWVNRTRSINTTTGDTSANVVRLDTVGETVYKGNKPVQPVQPATISGAVAIGDAASMVLGAATMVDTVDKGAKPIGDTATISDTTTKTTDTDKKTSADFPKQCPSLRNYDPSEAPTFSEFKGMLLDWQASWPPKSLTPYHLRGKTEEQVAQAREYISVRPEQLHSVYKKYPTAWWSRALSYITIDMEKKAVNSPGGLLNKAANNGWLHYFPLEAPKQCPVCGKPDAYCTIGGEMCDSCESEKREVEKRAKAAAEEKERQEAAKQKRLTDKEQRAKSETAREKQEREQIEAQQELDKLLPPEIEARAQKWRRNYKRVNTTLPPAAERPIWQSSKHTLIEAPWGPILTRRHDESEPIMITAAALKHHKLISSNDLHQNIFSAFEIKGHRSVMDGMRYYGLVRHTAYAPEVWPLLVAVQHRISQGVQTLICVDADHLQELVIEGEQILCDQATEGHIRGTLDKDEEEWVRCGDQAVKDSQQDGGLSEEQTQFYTEGSKKFQYLEDCQTPPGDPNLRLQETHKKGWKRSPSHTQIKQLKRSYRQAVPRQVIPDLEVAVQDEVIDLEVAVQDEVIDLEVAVQDEVIDLEVAVQDEVIDLEVAVQDEEDDEEIAAQIQAKQNWNNYVLQIDGFVKEKKLQDLQDLSYKPTPVCAAMLAAREELVRDGYEAMHVDLCFSIHMHCLAWGHYYKAYVDLIKTKRDYDNKLVTKDQLDEADAKLKATILSKLSWRNTLNIVKVHYDKQRKNMLMIGCDVTRRHTYFKQTQAEYNQRQSDLEIAWQKDIDILAAGVDVADGVSVGAGVDVADGVSVAEAGIHEKPSTVSGAEEEP